MEGLERALRELPVTHAEDERLTDLLAVARSKFKVAASSLGMLGECTEGFEKMSGGSSGGKGGVRASDVDF